MNELNQIVVDPFLRSISHPEIYAIGFNNYPDDRPNPPYFTGWLGYQIREGFVRLLAAAVQHGALVWLGKGRYETAQRRRQAKAKKNSMQLHHV